MWNSKHMARGASLTERGKLSKEFAAELRLYRDFDRDGTVYAEQVEDVDCEGMSCEAVVEDEDTAEILNRVTVLDSGHFVANNSDDVHVVLPHRGIYLTLDRSQNNAIAKHKATKSPLSFGAWMDDAGFFVAVKGTYTDGVDGEDRAARMAVAAGERTGSRPAADAVWPGSMVGTVLEGDDKDDILRGDAELTFKMETSELYANFVNIRNYDKFGGRHRMKEVEKGRKNRLAFRDIPVDEDGNYERTYDNNSLPNSGGSISGAFYGDGHGETAGTFEKFGVLGAFGAKKVTTN